MENLSDLLPSEAMGWKKKDVQSYNKETLFEYINGGAELYLSFGFLEVLTSKFIKEDQPEIFVDIFDMGDSFNAFGIFLHFREVIDTTYGQGSQYTSGNLLFWKDRYFVSILASPETEESKKAIKLLAGDFENKIKLEGPVPEIIKLIPDTNLIQESIRYFRHYIWLNSHYYISDQNILNIENNTHAVLAKYPLNGKQSILLIVSYPNRENALTAYNSFTKNYLPELSENKIVKMEDDTWTGCELNESLIKIVFNASEKEWAKKLLELIGNE